MPEVQSDDRGEAAKPMTPDLSAQVACVAREIAMRKRVYPKWVAAGKMKPDAADREIATMEAVLRTVCEAKKVADALEG